MGVRAAARARVDPHRSGRARGHGLRGVPRALDCALAVADHRVALGRCHAAAHDLVWIRWDGGAPLSLAWLDGVRCDSATISETEVRAGRARWECEERVTLRRGELGRTLLAPLRALRTAVPASALALDEHKWYARGRLTVEGVGADAVAIAERMGW